MHNYRIGTAKRNSKFKINTVSRWVGKFIVEIRQEAGGRREENFSLVNFSSHSLVLLCRLTYKRFIDLEWLLDLKSLKSPFHNTFDF